MLNNDFFSNCLIRVFRKHINKAENISDISRFYTFAWNINHTKTERKRLRSLYLLIMMKNQFSQYFLIAVLHLHTLQAKSLINANLFA